MSARSRHHSSEELANRLEPLYPDHSKLVNRRLSQLLVELQVASVIPRTLDRLDGQLDQIDQLHCLYVLRDAQQGWTLPLRRRYFAALNRTGSFLGGQGMPGFLENIRKDAIAGLSDEEREACGDALLAGGAHRSVDPSATYASVCKTMATGRTFRGAVEDRTQPEFSSVASRCTKPRFARAATDWAASVGRLDLT